MSESGTYRFQRLRTTLAKAVGVAICEPKLRLGRRRHDGFCDQCDEPHGAYSAEKLNFPLDDLDPDASSSIEKLRAMWNAQYVRVCLECSVGPGTGLEERGLDPSKDYTESVPMRHSTKWIHHDNLEILAAEAAESEFGERVYDVEAAVVGALNGNVSEDWMRSEYGHRFRILEGAVEEKAEKYRSLVFKEADPDV